MRDVRSVVGLVLAGAVLAGCGGGKPVVQPTTHDPAVTLDRLKVPAAYDSSRGWQQVLDGVPADGATVPVAVAPRSNTVAVMAEASGRYIVRARDAGTGAVRWSSRQWRAPEPMTDPVDGTATGEIPDLVTARQGGHEYVVAYAHGMEGKDALHDGREIVKVAVYPADATGGGVSPVREATVPVQDGDGSLKVRDGGHGLLLTWGEGMTNATFAAAVDVTTGRVTRYDDVDALLSQCQDLMCDGNSVEALTSKGPLVAVASGGFGVPHAWFASDVAPKGAATGGTLFGGVNGSVAGAVGGHVVARWAAAGDQGDIWTVHSTATGAVEASVTCALSGYEESQAERHGYTAAASGDGRYVVAGPVAFDLTRKKGFCLSGDGDRKQILLEAVGDDGTAYGTFDDGSDDRAAALAQVSLATGEPAALPPGTEMPYAPLPHAAMFLTHDPAGHVRVSVLHHR